MSDDLQISGGAGGLTAAYEDMIRYAGVLDETADGFRSAGVLVAAAATDPELAQAAVLCPAEVARIHASLGALTLGRSGPLALGIEMEVLARHLRFSVETLQAKDALLAGLEDAFWDGAGWSAGLGIVPVAVGGLAVWGLSNDPRFRPLFDAMGFPRDLDDLQETLYDNPWMLDALSRMAPGLVQGVGFSLSGLLGPVGAPLLFAASDGNWPTGDYAAAVSGLLAIANRLGYLEDVGDFTVEPAGPATPLDLSTGGLEALLEEQRALATSPGQVQVIALDGAPPAYIVQIPGTQSWSPHRGAHPVDLTTNVELMAMQQRTVMEQQVLAAMERAGIGPHDAVMLSGHSQGGITAAALAADPAVRDRFSIESVVTAGSPIAHIDLPEDVSVLSLEHSQDPVPMLDGADNPDRPSWTTVRRELSDTEGTRGGPRSPINAHGSGTYATTGALVDGSEDPGLVSWRERNDHFLRPGTTRGYQIHAED
ncbi:hypothetical protein D9V41_06975 [Aeromicrobium phragmitis]|uniref:Alpha/beta hydrolase n=1 Tax=Aeromicrobium phragmitis TaxID=2478914 RepID=A0A3L8PL99_9ACTN|nr:hypothetical protein [Aeromicrobium phragmitis]RLV56176.1 hypothetical protein D9V41_06975 [Aeromicrobium phragmitis]